jgi:Flp pilus assembly protein TadG
MENNFGKKLTRRKSRRHGVEVVEMAIVLPIIILITLGTLEICEGTFLRQKLELAAHAGSRIAIRKNATSSDVLAAVQTNLDARGVNYGGDIASAVTITPDPETAPTLTAISVLVRIDTDENLRMPISVYRFLAGRELTGEVSMFKEYAND